ncbi:hypothetical protein F0267_00570 [Vibrio coralliilyticus]|uniref:Uncharacterized protein n=1 Tax=Vibrio coralliilyticus TaxID=190893 RepID=A0AAN0SHH3_9VIBR|nr:hypothetical protein [Vibrio coralliilyticus]AIW22617.1 hypothetical protein IX92_26505 [Vibrio coralliilyticus]NOH36713.1 hypothetical protein [Vibrio coralliilyticus]
MPESVTIGLCAFILIMLWFLRPKGGDSKQLQGGELDAILNLCQENPKLIERVSLLDTYGKEVVCELKLRNADAVRVAKGSSATEKWLMLKALKAETPLPEYLLENE